MTYLLMNKNNKVALIRYIESNKQFIILRIFGNFIVPLTNRLVTAWIFDRRAPISRMFMDAIYSKANIQDIRNYINVSYAVSLNDTFWIKPENSSVVWGDVSPYSNSINSTVARAMMGYGNLCNALLSDFAGSPELSTEGKFSKCWQRRNKRLYLLKRGLVGFNGVDGRETFSEYFTYQIATALGISNLTPYALGNFQSNIVVLSECFTSEKVGFLPLSVVLGDKSPEEELDYMRHIGSELQFREMMLLDCITLNYDRHLNNMGVLFNNDSLCVLRMSPIFDNNNALVPKIIIVNRSNEEIWKQIRDNNVPKRNFNNFLEQSQFYITPELANRLRRLTTFTLHQHPAIKVDTEYFNFVNGLVRYMARTILGIYTGRIKLDPFKTTYTSPYGLI